MAAARDILDTPRSAAAAFFAARGGPAEGFRRLARHWHPDVNRDPGAGEVFRHLVALRVAAEAAAGTRPAGTVRSFRGTDDRAFEMRHLRARPFDAGEILVGRSSVAYVVSEDFADLAETAAAWRPRFADAAMRAEMERFLPAPATAVATTAGRVMGYRRTPDQILLGDLVGHLGGRLDPFHAAWLASGLMNLCCWLEWAGLSHGWIGPDTVLVSPTFHSVALTGPFLFAAPLGTGLAALPERTLSVVPRLGLPDAVAEGATDRELARLTVREALGDPGGGRILSDGSVPQAFALWLATPPAGDARRDYAGWETAREAAFGPRRFVELKVSSPDVYGA